MEFIVNKFEWLVTKGLILTLPDDLVEHMELAEEARSGNIDVAKIYRPMLKVINSPPPPQTISKNTKKNTLGTNETTWKRSSLLHVLE